MSVVLSASVESGLLDMFRAFARDCVNNLDAASLLKGSVEEAVVALNLSDVHLLSRRSAACRRREAGRKEGVDVDVGIRPKVLLPFCGVVMSDWCGGVRLSHGLHTQCTMAKVVGGRYCKTCQKQADNSATGKPTYGDIEDRSKFGVDYRDPKGKLSMPYANIAEKLGIKMEAAHAEAAKLGWTIPAEQLVKRKTRRGRPAKSAAVSDTDSETSDAESKPKKRGRPSKAKKTNVNSEDDQIALLIAEAYEGIANESKMPATVKTVAAKKKVAEKKVNKSELKKRELQKEASALGLEITNSELEDLKIGDIRKRITAHKKAAAKAEKEAAKAEKEVVKSEEKVDEYPDEVAIDINDAELSEEDVEDEMELSETMEVDGVEYYVHQQDGNTILFSMDGEPVGVYDDETGTIQECDFDEE